VILSTQETAGAQRNERGEGERGECGDGWEERWQSSENSPSHWNLKQIIRFSWTFQQRVEEGRRIESFSFFGFPGQSESGASAPQPTSWRDLKRFLLGSVDLCDGTSWKFRGRKEEEGTRSISLFGDSRPPQTPLGPPILLVLHVLRLLLENQFVTSWCKRFFISAPHLRAFVRMTALGVFEAEANPKEFEELGKSLDTFMVFRSSPHSSRFDWQILHPR